METQIVYEISERMVSHWWPNCDQKPPKEGNETGNMFQYFTKRIKTAQPLHQRRLGLLKPGRGRVEKDIKRIQVNLTIKYLEDQGEVRSKIDSGEIDSTEAFPHMGMSRSARGYCFAKRKYN